MGLELSKSDLSKLFDVSVRTISTWQQESDFPQPQQAKRGNRYDGTAVFAWWYERQLAKLIEDEGDTLDLTAARSKLAIAQTRKAQVETEIKEAEAARLKGEQVPVRDAVKLLEKTVIAFRAKILALPRKAAPHLLGHRTLPAVESAIEEQLHDALNELAAMDLSQLEPVN